MRLSFRRRGHREKQRSLELFVCSIKGHVTPAAHVRALRPEDRGLGVELEAGRRFARCTRCDAWIATTAPASPARDHLPDLEYLPVPRRGKELKDALVLRVIAVDRALHSVIFGIAAAALILLYSNLHAVHSQAHRLLDGMASALAGTGADPRANLLVRTLQDVARLRSHALLVLGMTAVGYCVVEGVEAVGLWRERRWAEYLTALATAGFLPFEIHELLDRRTVVRVGALVVNVAILLYLVWAKRLFGLRGGSAADRRSDAVDPVALFSPGGPAPPG